MVKKSVLVLGVVLAVVGVLGFVPAAIMNGNLLGIFAVDTIHNIVHLLSGVLAILFAMRGESQAKLFAKVFGVVYALVAVLGFVAEGLLMQIMAVNMADHVLHVILALAFLYVGFVAKGTGSSMMSSGPSMPQPTL